MSKPSLLAIAVFFVGLLLTACGGQGSEPPVYSPEQIAAGETLYSQNCESCHGPTAEGVENLGKNLVTSQFVRDRTDAELLAYVLEGRSVDDPLNTTGIAMPAKGGNKELKEEQIKDIIAFLRSIQQ